MHRLLVPALATLLFACGGQTAPDTGVIVRAATGPAVGGADIQYFGMILYVDAAIPADCPTVESFDVTLGAPHVVDNVFGPGAAPLTYDYAMLANVDNSAGWTNQQVSDDLVFPMLPVGTDVMLCTYPLDASLAPLAECTVGADTGTTVLGVLELTGESSCTTPQDGAVVGGATGNNSPTLTVLNTDLNACVGGDIAFTELQIDDPDGDDVTLVVTVVSGPAGVSVSPSGPTTVSSGGTITVTASGANAGAVVLEYALTDAFGLVGDGPFTVTLNLLACP